MCKDLGICAGKLMRGSKAEGKDKRQLECMCVCSRTQEEEDRVSVGKGPWGVRGVGSL